VIGECVNWTQHVRRVPECCLNQANWQRKIDSGARISVLRFNMCAFE
jgi:hypothetical protein